MVNISAIREYWNRNPLFSYEFATPGSPAFYEAIDAAKKEDIERFALGYWDFPSFAGKKVLDIGCGPGWLTIQYAKHNAMVRSIDLTPAAVDLAQGYCRHAGVNASITVGNAEELEFPDATFDLVVASGVLHHTPDTMGAFREARRVLKPGGIGKITLYRRGILHHPAVFRITRAIMRLVSLRHPGADLATASTPDEFIRRYDGDQNPLAIGKTNAQWAKDLEAAGFTVLSVENHFFPKRFLPFANLVPIFVHKLLDRGFGTMAYFTLAKR